MWPEHTQGWKEASISKTTLVLGSRDKKSQLYSGLSSRFTFTPSKNSTSRCCILRVWCEAPIDRHDFIFTCTCFMRQLAFRNVGNVFVAKTRVCWSENAFRFKRGATLCKYSTSSPLQKESLKSSCPVHPARRNKTLTQKTAAPQPDVLRAPEWPQCPRNKKQGILMAEARNTSNTSLFGEHKSAQQVSFSLVNGSQRKWQESG